MPSEHQNLIVKLPAGVINQIAAGEVVERPANMVKELVENALDAGADKIEIRFDDGGRFVQITDNGCGIQQADLNLALAPHSTSKIQSVGDLWKIKSYGFRGEALASIAEVSNMLLISKPRQQKQAARVKSQFGDKSLVQPTNSIDGTTIVIKDLFKNVPARLKFLKSAGSESYLIKNTLKAMALSRPSIEFKVFQKDKLLFYWGKKNTLQQRAAEVLGFKDSFAAGGPYAGIQVSAVLCPPNETARNRKYMWFFTNGRWVEDSALYSAVLNAYRGLLMHGEYPQAVVSIECPVEDVDVNVHPAKARVRFKDASLVFKAVHHSLRDALAKTPWLDKLHGKNAQSRLSHQPSIAPSRLSRFKAPPPSSLSSPAPHSPSRLSRFKAPPPSSLSSPAPHSPPRLSRFKAPLPLGGGLGGGQTTPKGRGESSVSLIPPLGFGESAASSKLPIAPGSRGKAQSAQEYSADLKGGGGWLSLHVLSQAHLTYIVAESPSAVVFIDQHAAHERVLYEKLMLSWKKGKIDIQHSLIPLVVAIDSSLVEGLLSVQKELSNLGLEIDRSGPEAITVRTAPALLKSAAIQKALMLLADEINAQGASFAFENAIAQVCASLACHSAVRAGQSLSQSQMQELLKQMDLFAFSSFCPHGRPVFVEYPLTQMEKDFGRIT